jgi:hypothetical protein
MTNNNNERRELTAAELDMVGGGGNAGLILVLEGVKDVISSYSGGVSRGVACDGIGA